jgi:hypothetical protein
MKKVIFSTNGDSGVVNMFWLCCVCGLISLSSQLFFFYGFNLYECLRLYFFSVLCLFPVLLLLSSCRLDLFSDTYLN